MESRHLGGGTVGRAVPASRPPLPTVGADHRAAQRCGKTGQTSFATTVPKRNITARNGWMRGDGTVGRASRPAGTTGILPVAAYGLAHDTREPEIVAHLFKLYANKMKWCR